MLDLRTVNFGDSSVQVSEIGLGLAALGRPGYINLGHGEDLQEHFQNARMAHHAQQMLSIAHQYGVRYFDAAQSYGRAESFLSNWLKNNPGLKITAGSKWGYYYTANWQIEAEKHEIKEHSLQLLQKQWPESKERLSPALKIYHVHSATFESGVLKNKEVLSELHRIQQEENMIIGLSLSGENQGAVLKEALKVVVDGTLLFGSVQATFNLLETSVTPVLQEAHNAGWGVIVKEAVANGRLTPRNQKANFMPALSQLATEKGVSVDALAMAFVLRQPFVTTVLSGSSTASQLHSNLHAITVDLSDKELQKLSKIAISPKTYWEERSKLKWN